MPDKLSCSIPTTNNVRSPAISSIRLLYCIQNRLNSSPKILHLPLLLYSTLRHSPSSYSALLSSTLLPSVLLYYILNLLYSILRKSASQKLLKTSFDNDTCGILFRNAILPMTSIPRQAAKGNIVFMYIFATATGRISIRPFLRSTSCRHCLMLWPAKAYSKILNKHEIWNEAWTKSFGPGGGIEGLYKASPCWELTPGTQGGMGRSAKSPVIAANEGHPHITKPENPTHHLLHLHCWIAGSNGWK